MDNDLKLILSKFLKISIEQISEDTIIDSSVLKGSVLFHRMISRVNDLYQIEIKDYPSIKTYQDLLREIKNAK